MMGHLPLRGSSIAERSDGGGALPGDDVVNGGRFASRPCWRCGLVRKENTYPLAGRSASPRAGRGLPEPSPLEEDCDSRSEPGEATDHFPLPGGRSRKNLGGLKPPARREAHSLFKVGQASKSALVGVPPSGGPDPGWMSWEEPSKAGTPARSSVGRTSKSALRSAPPIEALRSASRQNGLRDLRDFVVPPALKSLGGLQSPRWAHGPLTSARLFSRWGGPQSRNICW
jgi:hypothetical protein